MPAALAGQRNGELAGALLWVPPGPSGAPVIHLVEPAARSWRALAAAAVGAGYVLRATSAADSYRTLSQQITVFLQRYTRVPLIGRPTRMWNGVVYYQLPNTAVAAVPGTSNHGLGLAVDVAGQPVGSTQLMWMLAHAWAFGWSWETQSESWHIRYCTGDALPPAVHDYERLMGMGVWDELLPDFTKRQTVSGRARDVLWSANWAAHDALEVARRVEIALAASAQADEVRDTAMMAAITALTGAGTPGRLVDVADVLAAITKVGADAETRFTELHTQLSDAFAEIERLRAQLAAGAAAEADALRL